MLPSSSNNHKSKDLAETAQRGSACEIYQNLVIDLRAAIHCVRFGGFGKFCTRGWWMTGEWEIAERRSRSEFGAAMQPVVRAGARAK
jgi:hypothetical protein